MKLKISFKSCISLFIIYHIVIFANVIDISMARSLKEIKESKIIKIGCARVASEENLNDPNIPYYMGFDLELSKSISKEIEKKLKIQTEWVATPRTDQRIPFLKEGKADLIIRTFSITEKRKKIIDFSVAYFDNPGLTVVVPNTTQNVTNYQDLAGKKVIVTGKSTSEYFVLKNIPKVKILPVANDEYAIDYLLKGKADAYVQDFSMCLFHVSRFNMFRLAGEPFNPGKDKDQYGIGMTKGSKDLKKLIDEILGDLTKNGQVKKIYKKWYGDKMANVRKVTPLFDNHFNINTANMTFSGSLEEKRGDFYLFKSDKGKSFFIPLEKINYLEVLPKK